MHSFVLNIRESFEAMARASATCDQTRPLPLPVTKATLCVCMILTGSKKVNYLNSALDDGEAVRLQPFPRNVLF